MLLLAIWYVENDWGRNIVCSDHLEKLRVTQLLKKFPAFCGTQMLVFLVVVQKSIPWYLQGVIGIPSVLLHLIYGIFILVVPSHIHVCPPSPSVPFYELFFVHISVFIRVIWLSELYFWRVQIMKTYPVHVSPSSCYYLCLRYVHSCQQLKPLFSPEDMWYLILWD